MRFSLCDGIDTWQCMTCMEETKRNYDLQQWLSSHPELMAIWCPHHGDYKTAVFTLNPFRTAEEVLSDVCFICACDYGHGYLSEVPCDGSRPPTHPQTPPRTPPQALPVPVIVIADDADVDGVAEDIDMDINLDIIQRIVESHHDDIDEGFNNAFDIVEGWA